MLKYTFIVVNLSTFMTKLKKKSNYDLIVKEKRPIIDMPTYCNVFNQKEM